LRRVKGWRKPEGAVVVARPSKWGNPFRIVPDGSLAGELLYKVVPPEECRFARFFGGELTLHDAREQAVDCFLEFLEVQAQAEIRADLAGRDLACWCPLDQPCHADVLLELANGGPPMTTPDLTTRCVHESARAELDHAPVLPHVLHRSAHCDGCGEWLDDEDRLTPSERVRRAEWRLKAGLP